MRCAFTRDCHAPLRTWRMSRTKRKDWHNWLWASEYNRGLEGAYSLRQLDLPSEKQTAQLSSLPNVYQQVVWRICRDTSRYTRTSRNLNPPADSVQSSSNFSFGQSKRGGPRVTSVNIPDGMQTFETVSKFWLQRFTADIIHVPFKICAPVCWLAD